MAEQNQNYKVYDFQSVGESLESFRQNRRIGESTPTPIGIQTPMTMATAEGGLFVMNTSLTEQIKDNFKNLLMTNHGERLGLYDFGANLQELTMELGSEAFDTEAIRRIKVACGKYMPYLNLSTFEPVVDKTTESLGGISKVGLKITYSVPLSKSGPQQIQITLYTAG
jgi:phage baseplate assembly protein W